jgi:diaminohydroxyphosphoribosylaminopyrimidine deaminase/5-amino-6-(5-phosphoribosylamino)uracil reductase
MRKKMKNETPESRDKHYMLMALRMAEKGRGRTSPNPLVGAMLVKDDQIIGKGYHKRAGADHAEIMALKEAGEKAKGATLYINLEPCCHQGLTPPCVDRLIEAKLSRVVVAMLDPNPKVKGRGIKLLQEANIKAEVGLLDDKARFQNEVFLKYVTTNLPFIILKIALSMDGKIATKTGDSKWVTSELARLYVHKIRNEVDATCVGIGTIIRDDSRLTTRIEGKRTRDPIRVVIDSLQKVPLKANIFTQKSNATNIIVTTKNAFFKRKHEIEKTGSRVLEVRSRSRNKVDLTHMLQELGKIGITSMMIEGGAEIAASALEEGVVDKVIFFIAPKIVGGKTAPGPVGGTGVAKMSDAIKLKHIRTRNYGEDIMIEGYIEKPPSCVYSPLGCPVEIYNV